MKENGKSSSPTSNDRLREYEAEFHQSQKPASHVNKPNLNSNPNQKSYSPASTKYASNQSPAVNYSSGFSNVPNYNNGANRIKFNSMQDSFLNNCRHDRTLLEVSLIDNSVEKGMIVGFDVNTIIMENESRHQFLIMKSAVVKIMPTKFVNYIFNDNYKCGNFIYDYSGIDQTGG